MKKAFLIGLFAMVATACQPQDETISGYLPNEAIWVLKTLNDQEVSPYVTITFPTQGQVRGTGPCNSYSARQSVPLPWFKLNGLASTRRSCKDLQLEYRYFDLLRQMTEAEVLSDVLLLTGPAGKLVYQLQ